MFLLGNQISPKIARAILVKMPVEMCQFTKMAITGLNMSFMLQNFSQCNHSSLMRIFNVDDKKYYQQIL